MKPFRGTEYVRITTKCRTNNDEMHLYHVSIVPVSELLVSPLVNKSLLPILVSVDVSRCSDRFILGYKTRVLQ